MFPCIPLLDALSQPFKRAQLGLFHGKTKQYGNNVPFSKHKTRRTWLPNVQRKRLFSDGLGDFVRFKVTTRALRTIKKYGGLDNYLMKTRSDVLGPRGMDVRVQINAAKGHAGTVQELLEKQTLKPVPPILTVTSPIKLRRRLDHEMLKPPTMETVKTLRQDMAKVLGLRDRPLATSEQTLKFINRLPRRTGQNQKLIRSV